MAYADQALLSVDQDFIDRLSASAAVETDPADGLPPDQWARNSVWWIAAAPGFADAYASAVAGGVPRPGETSGPSPAVEDSSLADQDARLDGQAAHGGHTPRSAPGHRYLWSCTCNRTGRPSSRIQRPRAPGSSTPWTGENSTVQRSAIRFSRTRSRAHR